MEDASMVLAGPWHPAFGHLVFSEMLYDRACRKIEEYPDHLNARELTLTVHPKSESRLRGDKNTNLRKLNLRYPGLRLAIRLDEKIAINQVDIGEGGQNNTGKWI
jgi:Ribonuclease G/E